jgi:hypothetical protein
LKPLGFIGSDFVYGIARLSDRMADGRLPLFRVRIVDREGNTEKEYERPDIYITNAYVENDTVFLERATKQGDTLSPIINDSIKTPEAQASQFIRAFTTNTTAKQTVVSLGGEWGLVTTKPQIISAKEIGEGLFISEISANAGDMGYRYYVFHAGQVVLSTTNPALAVQRADDLAGVVIDERQSLVWRRGRANARNVSSQNYLGEAEITALRAGGGLPNRRVLNLTGTTVNQVLFYVNMGLPVYAVGEGGQEVQIVGFDAFNVVLLNMGTGQTSRRGLQDSEGFFMNGGSLFMVVMP